MLNGITDFSMEKGIDKVEKIFYKNIKNILDLKT